MKGSTIIKNLCVKGEYNTLLKKLSEGHSFSGIGEYCFYHSCKNGHLEIAQLLHDRGYSTHEDNDAALLAAESSGQHGIVSWLLSVGAKHY